ncbi:MAG: hypothetical protein GY868_14970, partial [Deltaproteobacteria bacterium]|nr:hypothetical protein [Deltaproteobacteria bacterium]
VLMPDGRFEVLDDDYSHLAWGQVSWSDYNGINGETWPACGDVDGDGVAEILIGLGAEGGGRVEIFEYGAGGVLHKDWLNLDWEGYNDAVGEVRPACGNIDGDPHAEIILGLGPGGDGKFQILDNTYAHLAWGQVDWPDYNDVNGEIRPACGNMEWDNSDEIVIGLGAGGGGRMAVFNYVSGSVRQRKWLDIGWRDYSDLLGETRPACGNIDQDWQDELVVGLAAGGEGTLLVFDDARNNFNVISPLRLQSEAYVNENGETWPAVKGMRFLNWWLRQTLDGFRKKFLEKSGLIQIQEK